MALLVVNQGEVIALKALLNHTAGQNVILKLFKNNYTPVDGSVETDFTEADFTGYSAVTLTGSSWSFTADAPSYATYAQQTFTSTADQTAQSIYGYYVVQATSGLLVWAERFTDAPYTMQSNGDFIKVTPTIDAYKVGE